MASIGNYRIEALLGAGGHGMVYRSTHPVLRRPVALKVLHDSLTHDREARERFVREARLTLDLRHNGIVSVYEIGEGGDGLYIVMELCEQGSLADAIARQSLPLPEVLVLGAAVADALAYAHQLGVVHRDLKPSNVLLRAGGAPAVADFGIATDPNAATTSAARGPAALGTPAYMAPEQIEGHAADARADSYAFGVMLYELIAGRLPFDGTPHQIVYGHLRTAPTPLRDVVPAVPADLDALVRRLLAKDPARRAVDMQQLAAELRAIAAGLAVGGLLPASASGVAAATPRPGVRPAPAIGVTLRMPEPHAAWSARYVAPPNQAAHTAAPIFSVLPMPGTAQVAVGSAAGARQARTVRAFIWSSAALAVVIAATLWYFAMVLEPWTGSAYSAPAAAGALTVHTTPTATAPTPTPVPIIVLAEPMLEAARSISAGRDRWSVGSVGLFQDSTSIRVYGVVRNDGERARSDTRVRVILRGSTGQEIVSNEEYVQRSTMAPGEYSGFRITLDDGDGSLPPEGQYTVDFEVRSDAANGEQRNEQHIPPATDIVVARAAGPSYGWSTTITAGEPLVGAIGAHAVFYDRDGVVVGLGTATPHLAAYPHPVAYPRPAGGRLWEPGQRVTLTGLVERMERPPDSIMIWPDVELGYGQQPSSRAAR